MTTRNHRRTAALLTATVLAIAACGGSDDSTSDDSSSGDTTTAAAIDDVGDDIAPSASDESGDTGPDAPVTSPPATDGAPDAPATTADTPASTAPADAPTDPQPIDFRTLERPAGDSILVGFVNSEGAPGLDFPEMRIDTQLAIDFLNEHGGMGDRPIQMVSCAVSGSPESSQECAQTLIGEEVELVMLGLDLFPAYDTYAAASIPVFGAIPVLPDDFSADALYITGGNATAMAGIAGYAVDGLGATSAAIISPDNPGGNSSLSALTASFDVLGVEYDSVTGGEVETDSGFQGLMREAARNDPDVVVSLYDDAGCIGAIRARVALGLEIPALSTPICGSADVLEVVGDQAEGWYFAGSAATDGSPTSQTLQEIVEPEYGPDSAGSLGLGALAISQVMSIASVANAVAADGDDVTGPSIYERLATSDDIIGFPFQAPFECGTSDVYSSVCSFVIPIGTYGEGNTVASVPGYEAFSVVEYLP
jgi:branched-chain amino acid transport system substrate-binding protein